MPRTKHEIQEPFQTLELTLIPLLQYIILVVDSTDRERLSISMEELHKMLGHEELSKAAILVFANKQARYLE